MANDAQYDVDEVQRFLKGRMAKARRTETRIIESSRRASTALRKGATKGVNFGNGKK